MQTVKKKLSELHKTDVNIRRHSQKQIEEYVRSLKMFGQIRPLVVTEDGEILVGNGMYEALTSMGAEDCDVYIVEGLNKAQRKKLMLADNKVYELGFTNIAALDSILADLGGDFDVPGYDSALLDMLVENPIKASESAMSYGANSIHVEEDKEEEPVRYSETHAEPQYVPPVKNNEGEYLPPEKTPQKASEDATEGRYIICPHCGERIRID